MAEMVLKYTTFPSLECSIFTARRGILSPWYSLNQLHEPGEEGLDLPAIVIDSHL